ncbi:MAG: hypothetical protein ACAI44_23005 [Candidatus Sericytochromatia bacterium]
MASVRAARLPRPQSPEALPQMYTPRHPLLIAGLEHQAARRWEAAAAAVVAYLQIQEQDPRAWLLLAQIYSELQLFFQEAGCLERYLALNPADVRGLFLLTSAWTYIGQREGVRSCYQRLLQLNPAGAQWFAALPPGARAELEAKRYSLFFHYLLVLYADPDVPDARLFDYIDSLPPPPDAPERPDPPLAETSLRQSGPIRVGYLSHELGDFSSSTALWPVLSHHGPEVELYAYNDTPPAQQSRLTSAFRGFFAHWREVSALDNAQLAELIRADGIEVLVDMGGITNADRHALFMRHPAPVQIGGLGFGFSAGHRGIAYCFSDRRLCPPEIAARFPEEVVLLESVCHWFPPEAYPLAEPPCVQNGYVTFGSANTLNKLNERVIALWARILLQLPTARLFLKTPAMNDPYVQAYWRELFAVLGVDARQLLFAGQGEAAHVPNFYPRIDIALDAFPYQGGVTSCEALWMGVPVLSLRHPDFRARAGTANILTVIGLDDWLADTEETYLERALTWAADPAFLQNQRSQLRDRLLASPICDGPAATREIEQAFFSLRQRVDGDP